MTPADLASALEARARMLEQSNMIHAQWTGGPTPALLRQAAEEIKRLKADNAFLHQRRGELVIARDHAEKALLDWSSGDGPNQELLEAQSNAAMRAAIAEDRLARIREAAGPAVAALEWALDLLDMYDGKLVELGEPAERVNNLIHTQGKANARADLRALARELEA